MSVLVGHGSQMTLVAKASNQLLLISGIRSVTIFYSKRDRNLNSFFLIDAFLSCSILPYFGVSCRYSTSVVNLAKDN